MQHIQDVRQALAWMGGNLSYIAAGHDWTKLQGLDQFHADFEAKQKDPNFDFLKAPWYQRHIAEERHHLDQRVPEDVNLFDVLERVADITTAGMARTGRVFDDTLSPEVLALAYKNTVEMLKANIEVVNEPGGD
jgi:hypothetical protein